MTKIPDYFFEVTYNGSQYPGVANGLAAGANCQHFCYEILRHFGYEIGNLRSSQLWEDVLFTEPVKFPKTLDLVLFNRTSDPYGAHVGIFKSDDQILHLSKKNGKPATGSLSDFKLIDEYQILIGFKRPIKKS